MTTSIAKNNVTGGLPATYVPILPVKARRKTSYNWVNIITWSVVICMATVWVSSMGIAFRAIYIRITITKTVVSQKGGQK